MPWEWFKSSIFNSVFLRRYYPDQVRRVSLSNVSSALKQSASNGNTKLRKKNGITAKKITKP